MIDKHFSCSFAETFSLVHFDNTVIGQSCYLRKIRGNCNRVDVCIKITNGLCYPARARKQFSMFSMEQPNLLPTHFLREKPWERGREQPIAQQQSLNCTPYTAINGHSYGAYLALEVIRLRETSHHQHTLEDLRSQPCKKIMNYCALTDNKQKNFKNFDNKD